MAEPSRSDDSEHRRRQAGSCCVSPTVQRQARCVRRVAGGAHARRRVRQGSGSSASGQTTETQRQESDRRRLRDGRKRKRAVGFANEYVADHSIVELKLIRESVATRPLDPRKERIERLRRDADGSQPIGGPGGRPEIRDFTSELINRHRGRPDRPGGPGRPVFSCQQALSPVFSTV